VEQQPGNGDKAARIEELKAQIEQLKEQNSDHAAIAKEVTEMEAQYKDLTKQKDEM